MSIDRLRWLPDHVSFMNELQKLDLGDEFGCKMTGLIEETLQHERIGEIKGWSTRLALYEVERRWMWYERVLALTEFRPLTSEALRQLSPSSLDRLRNPAEIVPWDKMITRIRGQRIVFESGSFRSIPTPVHVKHIGKCFWDHERLSVVAYEPRENIARYKPPNLVVLPRELRTEFLRHIPTVDIVTEVPPFGFTSIKDFWSDRYTEMSKHASEATISFSWDSRIRQGTVPANVKTNFANTWESFDTREYFFLSTGDWDQTCEGTDKFIDLAAKRLLS